MALAIGLFLLSMALLSWPITQIVQRLYGLDEPEIGDDNA
jgi:hypothetical protein